MGRSVSYPTDAIVAFRMIDEAEDDWDWAYECLVEDIVDTARSCLPSLEPFDCWRGREDRILLRNAFADCGISTYCGLAAIWIVERDDSLYWEADYRKARSGRAQQWLTQVSDTFIKVFGELHLVGRFSNGEAIFERANSAP